MSTIAPPQTVTFVSRGHNQRITIEGERKQQLDRLNRVIVARSDGKVVQFERSYAVIGPHKIIEVCDLCKGAGSYVANGELAECANCEGSGEVSRPASMVNGDVLDVPFMELLAFLRNHENFNAADKPGAFWEEGAAPQEPQPTMAEQMQAIALASTLHDLEQLAVVREVEEATHNRVAILHALDAAERGIALLSVPDTGSEPEGDEAGEPDESGSEVDE